MRKALRISLMAAALVAGGGCSSISVQTISDPEADFAKYKTYSWLDLQLISNAFVEEVKPDLLPEARRRPA